MEDANSNAASGPDREEMGPYLGEGDPTATSRVNNGNVKVGMDFLIVEYNLLFSLSLSKAV
jgi:hypothetical protein